MQIFRGAERWCVLTGMAFLVQGDQQDSYGTESQKHKGPETESVGSGLSLNDHAFLYAAHSGRHNRLLD